jgi:hypothetical protein
MAKLVHTITGQTKGNAFMAASSSSSSRNRTTTLIWITEGYARSNTLLKLPPLRVY